MTIEGLRLRLKKIPRIGFSSIRKKKLRDTNFTIISNNCWAGMIYESYSLPKQTPTVGLFFMPEDYLLFLEHLPLFLSSSASLSFIKPSNSRWFSFMKNQRSFGTYPIGVLKVEEGSATISVEIFFMHYASPEEAKQKWERRLKRINWNRLLVKFDDQNGCSSNEIYKFESLPFKNKICFVSSPHPDCRSAVLIEKTSRFGYVPTSYEPFGKSRNCDITQIINNL